MSDSAVIISAHLGSGEQGRARKLMLEHLALQAGHVYNDRPSIGRWLVAMADEQLEHLSQVIREYEAKK